MLYVWSSRAFFWVVTRRGSYLRSQSVFNRVALKVNSSPAQRRDSKATLTLQRPGRSLPGERTRRMLHMTASSNRTLLHGFIVVQRRAAIGLAFFLALTFLVNGAPQVGITRCR